MLLLLAGLVGRDLHSSLVSLGSFSCLIMSITRNM